MRFARPDFRYLIAKVVVLPTMLFLNIGMLFLVKLEPPDFSDLCIANGLLLFFCTLGLYVSRIESFLKGLEKAKL